MLQLFNLCAAHHILIIGKFCLHEPPLIVWEPWAQLDKQATSLSAAQKKTRDIALSQQIAVIISSSGLEIRFFLKVSKTHTASLWRKYYITKLLLKGRLHIWIVGFNNGEIKQILGKVNTSSWVLLDKWTAFTISFLFWIWKDLYTSMFEIGPSFVFEIQHRDCRKVKRASRGPYLSTAVYWSPVSARCELLYLHLFGPWFHLFSSVWHLLHKWSIGSSII